MLNLILIITAIFAATVIGLVVCVIILFRKTTCTDDHLRWTNKHARSISSERAADIEQRLNLLAEECGFTFMWLEDKPSRWRVIPNTSAEQH